MNNFRLLWMLTFSAALATAAARRGPELQPAPEFDQHLEVSIQTRNDSNLLNNYGHQPKYPQSLEMSLINESKVIFLLDLLLNKDLMPDSYFEKHHHEVRNNIRQPEDF